MEFKLFALRHPDVKARLTAMHRRLVASGVDIMEQIMNDLGRKLAISAYSVGMAFFALSSGLTVQHMLDRAGMPEDAIREIMIRFFDAITAE